MRPWTGVWEPLMPDVVSPKVHQNNSSYVSSAELPSDSLRENFSMVGGYTENPEKSQNCQNWGVGACMGMDACLEQYSIQLLLVFLHQVQQRNGCLGIVHLSLCNSFIQ